MSEVFNSFVSVLLQILMKGTTCPVFFSMCNSTWTWVQITQLKCDESSVFLVLPTFCQYGRHIQDTELSCWPDMVATL